MIAAEFKNICKRANCDAQMIHRFWGCCLLMDQQDTAVALAVWSRQDAGEMSKWTLKGAGELVIPIAVDERSTALHWI
jgi:hypothetical protein